MNVLVTSGATVPFEKLLRAVLDSTTIMALHDTGYSSLTVQYGGGSVIYEEAKPASPRISISGFDFSTDIASYIAKADLIISHAGTGSILDALRAHKNLIVVANADLMDNHQAEIANELSKQGHLLVSTPAGLAAAVEKAARFQFTHLPEGNSSKFADIVDAEAGL